MDAYSIVHSGSRSAIPHRRTGGDVITSWPEERVRIESIGCEFSLERLYDGLALSNEPV